MDDLDSAPLVILGTRVMVRTFATGSRRSVDEPSTSHHARHDAHSRLPNSLDRLVPITLPLIRALDPCPPAATIEVRI